MIKKERKNKDFKKPLELNDNELANSGVSKILLNENGLLKQEVKTLKQSLKLSQDELEGLRSKNHELDKANSLLGYRLSADFLPEVLKFLASAGVGFATSLFFTDQKTLSYGIGIICGLVYIGILYLNYNNIGKR